MKFLILLAATLVGCGIPPTANELPDAPQPQINPDSLVYGVEGLCDYDEATNTYWFWGPDGMLGMSDTCGKAFERWRRTGSPPATKAA